MGKQPIAIDLFCGMGGWTIGLQAVGYRVIGFDIVRWPQYPGELILQDVATIDGAMFQPLRPALIVASPPCQAYSYPGHALEARAGGRITVTRANAFEVLGRPVHIGQKGRCDWICYRRTGFPSTPELFELEVKGPRRTPTPEQLEYIGKRRIQGFFAEWFDNFCAFEQWYTTTFA